MSVCHKTVKRAIAERTRTKQRNQVKMESIIIIIITNIIIYLISLFRVRFFYT